ncbi:hypothetical protein KFL_003830050 [Klebsormidium nitens]|uniref:Uncharacterized protein n=1 Tax=Klebsormidium nitens TaxID=105231 RepID=A0A1Y1IGH7_KLENI|nr:hypothetical protein KFL_003830050 [Klebsormidium nitens]|eukprot:GAQ87856.1 hypothetical protein KFL_003830050 [Klebsormidium nitens]
MEAPPGGSSMEEHVRHSHKPRKYKNPADPPLSPSAMPPPRNTKRSRGSRRKSLKPAAPGSSDNVSSDATHESVSSWRPSLGTQSYKWEQQKGRDTSFESSSRQGRGRERDLERSRSASRRARSAAKLSASAARLRQGSSGADSDDSVKFIRQPNNGELRRVLSVRSLGEEPSFEQPHEERVRERGGLERSNTGEKGETSSQRALRTEGAVGSDTSVEARPHRRSKKRDPAFASDSSFSFMKVDETIEEVCEEVSTMPVSRPRSEQIVLARPVDIAPPNLRTGPLGDRQFAKPGRNRGNVHGEGDGDSGIAQLKEGSLSTESNPHRQAKGKVPASPARQGDVTKAAVFSPPVTKLSGASDVGSPDEELVAGVVAGRRPFRSVEFNSGGGVPASCAGEVEEGSQEVAANKPKASKKGHRERKAHRKQKENVDTRAETNVAAAAEEKKGRARSPFKMAIFGRGREAGGHDGEGAEGVAAVSKERSKSPFRFPGFGRAFKGRAPSEEEHLEGKMEKRARSKSPLFGRKPQEKGGEHEERARSKSPFRMPGFGKRAAEQGGGDGVNERERSKSPFSRLRFGGKSKGGSDPTVPAPSSEAANLPEPVQKPMETYGFDKKVRLLEGGNEETAEGTKGPAAEASKRARSKSPFRMPRFGKKGPKEEPPMMRDQNHVAAVQLLFVKGHLPGGDLALLNPVVKTRGRSKSPFQRPEPVPKAADHEAPEMATKKHKEGRARSPFARMFSSKKVGRGSDAEYRPTAAPSAWTEGLVQLSDEEPDVTSAPARVDVSEAAKDEPVPQAEADGSSAPALAPQPSAVSEAPENEPVLEAPSDIQPIKAEDYAEEGPEEDWRPKGLQAFGAFAAAEESENLPEEPVPVVVSRVSAEEDAAKAPKKSPLKRLKSRQHRVTTPIHAPDDDIPPAPSATPADIAADASAPVLLSPSDQKEVARRLAAVSGGSKGLGFWESKVRDFNKRKASLKTQRSHSMGSEVASCAGLEAPLEQDMPDFADEDPLSPVPQGPTNSPPKKHPSPELAAVNMTSDAVAHVEPGHVADPGVSTESLFTLEVDNEALKSETGRSVVTTSVNTPGFSDQGDGSVKSSRPDELEAGETRGSYEPRFQEDELEEGEEDLLAASTDSEWAAIRALMTEEEEAPEVDSPPVSKPISGSPTDVQAPHRASEAFGLTEGAAAVTSWGPGGSDGDVEAEGGAYGSPERTFSDEYFGSQESAGEAEVAFYSEDWKAVAREEMATMDVVEKGSKSPRRKGVLSGMSSWLKRKSPTKAAAPGGSRFAVRDSKEGLAWDGGLDQFLVKREALRAPPEIRPREVAGRISYSDLVGISKTPETLPKPAAPAVSHQNDATRSIQELVAAFYSLGSSVDLKAGATPPAKESPGPVVDETGAEMAVLERHGVQEQGPEEGLAKIVEESESDEEEDCKDLGSLGAPAELRGPEAEPDIPPECADESDSDEWASDGDEHDDQETRDAIAGDDTQDAQGERSPTKEGAQPNSSVFIPAPIHTIPRREPEAFAVKRPCLYLDPPPSPHLRALEAALARAQSPKPCGRPTEIPRRLRSPEPLSCEDDDEVLLGDEEALSGASLSPQTAQSPETGATSRATRPRLSWSATSPGESAEDPLKLWRAMAYPDGRASVNLEEALESRRHLGLAPADVALLRSADRSTKTLAKGLAGLEPLPEEGAPAADRADVIPDGDASSEGDACVGADEGPGSEGRADVNLDEELGVECLADVTIEEEDGQEVGDGSAFESETGSVVTHDDYVGADGRADVTIDQETHKAEAEADFSACAPVGREAEEGRRAHDDVGLTAGFDGARSEIAAAVDRWGPTPVVKEQVQLILAQKWDEFIRDFDAPSEAPSPRSSPGRPPLSPEEANSPAKTGPVAELPVAVELNEESSTPERHCPESELLKTETGQEEEDLLGVGGPEKQEMEPLGTDVGDEKAGPEGGLPLAAAETALDPVEPGSPGGVTQPNAGTDGSASGQPSADSGGTSGSDAPAAVAVAAEVRTTRSNKGGFFSTARAWLKGSKSQKVEAVGDDVSGGFSANPGFDQRVSDEAMEEQMQAVIAEVKTVLGSPGRADVGSEEDAPEADLIGVALSADVTASDAPTGVSANAVVNPQILVAATVPAAAERGTLTGEPTVAEAADVSPVEVCGDVGARDMMPAKGDGEKARGEAAELVVATETGPHVGPAGETSIEETSDGLMGIGEEIGAKSGRHGCELAPPQEERNVPSEELAVERVQPLAKSDGLTAPENLLGGVKQVEGEALLDTEGEGSVPKEEAGDEVQAMESPGKAEGVADSLELKDTVARDPALVLGIALPKNSQEVALEEPLPENPVDVSEAQEVQANLSSNLSGASSLDSLESGTSLEASNPEIEDELPLTQMLTHGSKARGSRDFEAVSAVTETLTLSSNPIFDSEEEWGTVIPDVRTSDDNQIGRRPSLEPLDANRAPFTATERASPPVEGRRVRLEEGFQDENGAAWHQKEAGGLSPDRTRSDAQKLGARANLDRECQLRFGSQSAPTLTALLPTTLAARPPIRRGSKLSNDAVQAAREGADAAAAAFPRSGGLGDLPAALQEELADLRAHKERLEAEKGAIERRWKASRKELKDVQTYSDGLERDMDTMAALLKAAEENVGQKAVTQDAAVATEPPRLTDTASDPLPIPSSDKSVATDAVSFLEKGVSTEPGPVLRHVAIATEAVSLSEKATYTEQGLGVHDVSVGTDRVPLQERGVCTEPGPVLADVAAGPDSVLGTAEKSTGTEAGPVLVHVAAGPHNALSTKDESTATQQGPTSFERAAGPDEMVVLVEKSVGREAVETRKDVETMAGPGLDTKRGLAAAGKESVKSVVRKEEKGTGTEGLSETAILEHKVHLLRSQIKEARLQRDSLQKELERAAEEKATLASALAENEKPKAPRDAPQEMHELHRSLAKWQARAQRAEQELTRVAKVENEQTPAAVKDHASPLKQKSPVARALFPSGSPGKKGSATKSGDSPGVKLNGIPEETLAGELDGWKERALVAEKETEKAQKVRGESEAEAAELRGRVRRMGDDAAQMREEIAILRSTLEMQTLHGGAKGLEAEAAALKDALAREREQHRLEKLEWRETSARLKTLLAFWPEEVSDGVASGQRNPASRQRNSASGERSAQGSNGGMANDDLADGAASPIHVAAALAATSAADVRDSSESSNREFGGFSAGPTESPELFEIDSRSVHPLSPKEKSVRENGTESDKSEEVQSGAQDAKWYAKGLAVSEAAAAARSTAVTSNGTLFARRTGSPNKALSVVVAGNEVLAEKRSGSGVPADVFSSRSVSPVLRSVSPASARRGVGSPVGGAILGRSASRRAAVSSADSMGNRYGSPLSPASTNYGSPGSSPGSDWASGRDSMDTWRVKSGPLTKTMECASPVRPRPGHVAEATSFGVKVTSPGGYARTVEELTSPGKGSPGKGFRDLPRWGSRDSAEWAKAVERRDMMVAMDVEKEAPIVSEKKSSKRRSSRKKTHTAFSTKG